MAGKLYFFVALICVVPIIYACNEAICASVVSKCMLTQSCKCDLKDCSCCKDCFNCLSYLYSECCSCVGKIFYQIMLKIITRHSPDTMDYTLIFYNKILKHNSVSLFVSLFYYDNLHAKGILYHLFHVIIGHGNIILVDAVYVVLNLKHKFSQYWLVTKIFRQRYYHNTFMASIYKRIIMKHRHGHNFIVINFLVMYIRRITNK